MTKFNETPEFKKLDAEWRQKLKDSGFNEIENKDGTLKDPTGTEAFIPGKNYEPSRQAKLKQRYYQLAEQFLSEHQFQSVRDKQVWGLHCEGTSEREIAKKVGLGKGQVHVIVDRLRYHMLAIEKKRQNEPAES